jgi:hypothetical protein
VPQLDEHLGHRNLSATLPVRPVEDYNAGTSEEWSAMTDKDPSQAATPPSPQPAPLPASVGQETRVAMDLAGIHKVERRQKLARLIALAAAAVAVIAILFALFGSNSSDNESQAAGTEPEVAPAADESNPGPAAEPASAPTPVGGGER